MPSTPWIRRGTKGWLLQSERNRMSQLRGGVFRPTMVAQNRTHYSLILFLKMSGIAAVGLCGRIYV